MNMPKRVRPLRAIALVAVVCALGLPDRAAAQDRPPTRTELRQAVTQSEARITRATTAVAELEKLLKKPRPAGLTPKQRLKWGEHTKWLKGVVARLTQFKDKHLPTVNAGKALIGGGYSSSGSSGGSSGGAGGGMSGADMIQANMQMNMEFLALQNAMQMESRQYNAVSNALKVRHDSAMAAVRNMK